MGKKRGLNIVKKVKKEYTHTDGQHNETDNSHVV